MDIQMPVYLYDVQTAATQPRVVATFRDIVAAQDIANRLNALQATGDVIDSPFVVASPRSSTVVIDVSEDVFVGGYAMDVSKVAAALGSKS